jgi:hypothetical protein
VGVAFLQTFLMSAGPSDGYLSRNGKGPAARPSHVTNPSRLERTSSIATTSSGAGASQSSRSAAAHVIPLPAGLSRPTDEEKAAVELAALAENLVVPMHSAIAVAVIELKPERPPLMFGPGVPSAARRRGLNKIKISTHRDRVLQATTLSKEALSTCRNFVQKTIRRHAARAVGGKYLLFDKQRKLEKRLAKYTKKGKPLFA